MKGIPPIFFIDNNLLLPNNPSNKQCKDPGMLDNDIPFFGKKKLLGLALDISLMTNPNL